MAGEFAGGVTDYGGFEFKPAELTPALCDDLYDNLVGKFNADRTMKWCFDL